MYPFYAEFDRTFRHILSFDQALANYTIIDGKYMYAKKLKLSISYTFRRMGNMLRRRLVCIILRDQLWNSFKIFWKASLRPRRRNVTSQTISSNSWWVKNEWMVPQVRRMQIGYRIAAIQTLQRVHMSESRCWLIINVIKMKENNIFFSKWRN